MNLRDKEFLELLDENDSYAMAHYLNKVNLWPEESKILIKMFKDLDIFQDIALPGCDSFKKYTFILGRAFCKSGQEFDLKGAYVFGSGVAPGDKSKILIDSGTQLELFGINLPFIKNGAGHELVFLGIPRCVKNSIFINAEKTTMYVKKDILPQINKMISNKEISLSERNQNVIKEI